MLITEGGMTNIEVEFQVDTVNVNLSLFYSFHIHSVNNLFIDLSDAAEQLVLRTKSIQISIAVNWADGSLSSTIESNWKRF